MCERMPAHRCLVSVNVLQPPARAWVFRADDSDPLLFLSTRTSDLTPCLFVDRQHQTTMSGWDAYAALATGAAAAAVFGKDGTPWGQHPSGVGVGAVRNFGTLVADVSASKISSEFHFNGVKVCVLC